jgi:hypothetical protein
MIALWYGMSGLVNSDNDSWLGSYLWNKLIKEKAVVINESGVLTLNSHLLSTTYKNITSEIDLLALSLVNNKFNLDEQIESWMRTQVCWNPSIGYTIPGEFVNILEKCYEVPEQAHFHTPFYLSDFRSLNAAKNIEK